MEVIPAIDLREAKVVRLHQGEYERQTIYSSDPVGVALAFQKSGATRLHIVDLDGAAAGMPVNTSTIKDIAARVDIPIQVGGGIRTLDLACQLLDIGVQRVVLGTAAVEEPDLIKEIVDMVSPQAVVVGVDARAEMVAVRGWKRATTITASELMQRMRGLGVARFIYTDIARDGTLSGPNLQAVARVVRHVDAPVIASGGVASIQHLRDLADLGVDGAIVGSAVYTGAVNLAEAIAVISGQDSAPATA